MSARTSSRFCAIFSGKVVTRCGLNTKLVSMNEVPPRRVAIGAKDADGQQYELDGLSVEYPDWHFNVRPSNTEPLLRLNLEATTPQMMERKRDEVLALIRA